MGYRKLNNKGFIHKHGGQLARMCYRAKQTLMGFAAFACFSANAAGLSLTSPKSLDPLQQQRQHYLSARDALQKGQLKSYKKHRDQLLNYPLTPYLDYFELRRRLSRLPYDDVDQYLGNTSHALLKSRLTRQWLNTLAQKKRWHDYRTYYVASENTVLQCFALEARIRTGDRTALEEVAPLWNVGRSQPDECDPLFKLWHNTEHFTQALAWQRFVKAMSNGKTRLARYIAKRFDTEFKPYADLYLEVHRTPSVLKHTHRFREQSPRMHDIILHGIKRYARQDAELAYQQWQRYDAQQLFDDERRFSTQQTIASRLVRQGQQQLAENLIQQIPQLTSETLLEGLIREFLKEMHWDKALAYITRLPEPLQQSERWRYWRARALEQQSDPTQNNAEAQALYTELALQRGYYGFLAADRLGHQYNLGDSPSTIAPQLMGELANRQEVLRARELLMVDDALNARREWFHFSQTLTPQQHIAAAKLASQWGWHHNTIISLASAKHWDDLQLRFPLAYNKQVLSTAQKLQVSPLLLYAITRQESAFAVDARSPAGAMGLMQLLPSTAKMTARKAGLRYRKHDLLSPEMNIELGSRYITTLLKQFDGNRILATAAYNAGPRRVKGWLKETDKQLPYDVWIEIIPFKETRKYVQNVLAYSVIYGYRMGTVPSLLSAHETNQPL